MDESDNAGESLKPLQAIGDTKVPMAQGIAGLALTLAMKYHDITTVQDGTLYQQYKLEGVNMSPLHIDVVFETAIKIEGHLLRADGRLSDILMEEMKALEGEAPSEDQNTTE